ncbi:MAG: HAD family hydrolase [Minisyncoccia bacterium]
MKSIEHIWFDFSDTIAHTDKNVLNDILWTSYAKAVGRPVTEELKKEFAEKRKKYKSGSAIFTSLGLPSGYLAEQIRLDSRQLYSLTDPEIPNVLSTLKDRRPISIFSNNKLDKILPALGIDTKWFAHILGPDQIARPKPALDGFRKMVELSGTTPAEILYIGDDIHKDLLPAKEVGITTGLLWKESPEADVCFRDFDAILAMSLENST